MSREAELEAQVRTLQHENGQLTARAQIAEQQVEDAKKAVQTYITEIEKLSKDVPATLRNLGLIQEQAMNRARHIAKMYSVLAAANAVIEGLKSECPKEGLERVNHLFVLYTQTQETLKHGDPEQQPAGGPDPQAPDHRR